MTLFLTLRSENEDGNVDVSTWKSVYNACAKSRKTLLQSSVARDRREKVSFDVLMKTCNILSKIMVILDIYGTKVLTIFTVEYRTTFFEFILKDWACIKCFACFFGLFTFFFASEQCRVRLEKYENESYLFSEWVFSSYVWFVILCRLFQLFL